MELKIQTFQPIEQLMGSEQVVAALSQLRMTTEGIEQACGGDRMAGAVAERANAIQRLAIVMDERSGEFSATDLQLLRELHGRGTIVMAGMTQARRTFCSAAAELDRMRHVLTSFAPTG